MMSDNVKYSYPALCECFRDVVRDDKISHIVVQREPRYAVEVGRYLQTIRKARLAVKDSKLLFRG